MDEKIRGILGLFLVVLMFISLTYFVQNNLDYVQTNLNFGLTGMLLFVFIMIVSIVVAPVSAAPLFPVASGIWGWPVSGLLGALGWTLGAVVAFIIARKYGVALVKKVISLEKLYKYEKKIPEQNLFWTIVFLRMVTPFDGVSYIAGLFTKIDIKSYTFATILGLIPFSFFLAYMATIPTMYSIIAAGIMIIVLIIFVVVPCCR